ncbi:MAG: hypothetical protein IPP59_11530 [Betaproteobacteria bacterium]|jgi:hypothetical protein|nr:hypothetical protein [Candidatus Dechloromonas phosphorivorans]
MKKSLFFKSGISLLMLAGVGAASASEASFEGGMYSDLQALQVSAEWTTPTTAVRGAQGPIRSVDVPRIEGDMYESISRFQSVQTSDKSTSERGAQGPVREDTFMLIP